MKPATLSRSADFRRTYGEGTRARRNGVGIAAVDRKDGEPPRVGFAVRKSAGSAVTRNRIKRRLRAAVGTVELLPGYDVVVSGDRTIASLDFQVLVDKLQAALASVGAAR